jgi:hypothetical protein
VTAVVLIAVVWLLPALLSSIAGLVYPGVSLDAKYDGLRGWMGEQAGFLKGVLTNIMVVTWGLGMGDVGVGWLLPGAAPFSTLASTVNLILSPWIGWMYTAYTMYSVLDKISIILQASWGTFIVYGALLYAVPWKVGRGAGGGMIAGAIVYYLGLPLLPAFVTAMSGGALPTMTFPEVDVNALMQQGNWDAAIVDLALSFAKPMSYIVWIHMFMPALYLIILGLLAGGVALLLGSRTPWLIGQLT